MFKQSLFALALVASLAYCGSARALDQMSVPDSYSATNTVPSTEVDRSPADIGEAEKSDPAAHESTSVALPLDDSAADPGTAGNVLPANAEPGESANPAHPHKSPSASTPTAAHAKAHKNHANVHWQSLLPGVMK